MTVGEILQPLSPHFREDAIWLLSTLFHCSKSEVMLSLHRELDPAEKKRWNAWWRRRKKGEPLQYICGEAPFWGRDFLVNPHVLIPRPETEVLVEIAMRLLRNQTGARVIDIGTGSGCIAITLKAERPDLVVLGTDISPKALAVAELNAQRHGAAVTFEKHDLFSEELRARGHDLVVSNPPYLDFRRDKVAADVKKWEPRSALEPSLKAKTKATRDRASWCAERILEACAHSPPRHTLLELSPRVAAALERRWKKHASVQSAERISDLAGRKRFLLITWKNHG